MMRQFLKKKSGFTAIEMMVVIAIIFVMMSIAIPSYHYYAAQNRLKGAALQLYYDLLNARMQAIKKGAQVTVSFTNDHDYSITAGGQGPTKTIHPDFYDVNLSTGFNPVYNRNGTASSAGTIVITSTSSLLTSKSITITIKRAGGIKLN
jgi:prepilin-type N-terminal cleavage/methylation domain-containing protein